MADGSVFSSTYGTTHTNWFQGHIKEIVVVTVVVLAALATLAVGIMALAGVGVISEMGILGGGLSIGIGLLILFAIAAYYVNKNWGFLECNINLVSNEWTSPSALAGEYRDGAVKEGLLGLDDHQYQILRVRGDGHCLFRSIGIGLMLGYEANPDKETFIDFLNGLKITYPGEELARDIDDLIYYLSLGMDALTFMRNREASDTMVRFLRHLACAHNRIDQERIQTFLVMENVNTYLNKMGNMKYARYGDEHEICAISNALQIKFLIADVEINTITPRGDDVNRPQGLILPPKGIGLLHRPNHYDYLGYLD